MEETITTLGVHAPPLPCGLDYAIEQAKADYVAGHIDVDGLEEVLEYVFGAASYRAWMSS